MSPPDAPAVSPTSPLFRSRPGGFDIRPAAPGDVRAINDFIHLSEGLSNSYLISTSDGRIIVNTGMGFEAPVHRANYDAVDPSPTRYIILTQGHVDHVGGVDHLCDPGTEIVAQAGNLAHQADDARIARFRARRSGFAFADAIARANRHVEERGQTRSTQSRPTPTITFRDRLDLELGGLSLQLLSVPGGETLDSLAIWLPEHEICFTGNLFSALFGHFPNLVTLRGDKYRSPLAFIESLDRVLALEPALLLVGHHEPIEGKALIRAELERLRGAVEYVHEATVRGMNDGRTVHALMAEIELPPELAVGEGYGKVSWSVRAIWEYYAGWFHARSATELYPVAPEQVAPDLVALAGGPAPVAARARERLAEGAPVEAIQLAEAALAAAPDHRDALEVSRAAHEALAKASHNFWETAWLQKQIRELEVRLGEGK